MNPRPPRPERDSAQGRCLHVRIEIDSRYHTIADRSGRATAGYSGGGFGSMHYATRHPDLFAAGASFSGLVDVMHPGGIAIVSAASVVNVYCSGDGDPRGPWGDVATHEVFWHGHNPTDLAPNLGGMSVFLSVGNGVPCNTDDVGRAVTAFPLSEVEPVARDMAQSFSDAMNDAGVAHTTYFASCGIHDYPYFGEGLHRFWPQMLAAFGSSPPDAFDYRTTDATFSVWGWTFEADGGRAAEFLDVTDASCGGLTLHGSGLTKVTTGSCFAPASGVGLRGAGESAAVADADGRITFSVDLGPAHDFQQYTPVARVMEAAGGYWTIKTVAFETS